MEIPLNFAFQLRSLDATPPVTFSVVINTDGRIDYLKRTIAGLRYQDYPHFEVCVVSGPTEDGTRAYLETLGDDVKVAFCAHRNLSQSRNIGIALADGDVVAFIDDDAVPEREWLSDLARSYADRDVAAVGGFVYDHTGVKFQARYVTTNRRGYATSCNTPAAHLNYPYSQDYPHLLGTNCSFRRDALLDIGGFDEEYEYFLDETDVCCRINDAGYRIVQRADAFVHHKYAPSHMRDEKKIVRNWYPLLKNRVYFGLRNGVHHHTTRELVEAGIADAATWESSVVRAAAEGVYTPADVALFYQHARSAIEDGVARGAEPAKLLTAALIAEHHRPFRQLPLSGRTGERRVICFVTQDYPPGQNGGIARNISQLARSLAKAGHHVHVLTKARDVETVDFEDGVWVHRIQIRHYPAPDVSPIAPLVVPSHIWNYGQTMLDEVRRINARRRIDIVYSPLWDCEPLAFILAGEFPTILALQTTMMFWLESQPLRAADPEWMETFGKPILAMETMLIQRATLIHGNSRAIVRDIEAGYALEIDRRKLYFSPHGVEDWSSSAEVKRPERWDGKVRLLFVGRLESRKGIDVLLDAAPAVLAKYPEAILDIVGDDTIVRASGGTYKADFLARDIAPGVRNRIVFHGRVEEAELRAFYAGCDVFVGPSRYESFGLVFLEAMVFGKPVIACDSGGGPEVVTDGKTGFLIPPGDRERLAARMEQLLANPLLRDEMGKAARQDYEARFTDQVMVDDLIAVLDQHYPHAGVPSALRSEMALN